MHGTTITTVQADNPDERIYLASDLEYAMIPVTDGSGHTVVQQVTVQVINIITIRIPDESKQIRLLNGRFLNERSQHFKNWTKT